MSLAGSRYAGRYPNGYKARCLENEYAARFPTARQCVYCEDGTTPPCWEIVFSGIDTSECCSNWLSPYNERYSAVAFDVVGNPNQTYILSQCPTTYPPELACVYYLHPNDPTASMGVSLRRYLYGGQGSPTPFCPPMPPLVGEVSFWLWLEIGPARIRVTAWRPPEMDILFRGGAARQEGDSCDQEYVIENNRQRIECAFSDDEGMFEWGQPGGGYATVRPVWW